MLCCGVVSCVVAVSSVVEQCVVGLLFFIWMRLAYDIACGLVGSEVCISDRCMLGALCVFRVCWVWWVCAVWAVCVSCVLCVMGVRCVRCLCFVCAVCAGCTLFAYTHFRVWSVCWVYAAVVVLALCVLCGLGVRLSIIRSRSCRLSVTILTRCGLFG